MCLNTKVWTLLNTTAEYRVIVRLQLKEIRACFFSGALQHVDFVCSHLCTLEPCFQMCVRDLRSAVVREACITSAYVFPS